MPPQSIPPTRPSRRGADALTYLAHYGVRPRTPVLRSSDYSTLSDPYRFFLTRRLGLTDCLSYSEALVRGSWSHTAFQAIMEPTALATRLIESTLEARFEELDELGRHHNIQPTGMDRIKAQEEKDAWSSFAWIEALRTLPLPSNPPLSLPDWLAKQQVLGFEIMAYVDAPELGVTLGAQFDAVVYQEATNSLWIIDLKTTGGSPQARLDICTLEFQTQLYLDVARRLVSEGVWAKKFDIPQDARIGGFIHVALLKPSIKFGQNDRPCTERQHVLKTGPRKGQVEIRRDYYGDPLLPMYVQRVGRWYHSEGEFSHTVHSEPCVNRSITRSALMDEPTTSKEYLSRLTFMAPFYTMDAHPENFRMGNIHALASRGRTHHLLPFYTQPVGDWPDLIRELGLLQLHRDEVGVTTSLRDLSHAYPTS